MKPKFTAILAAVWALAGCAGHPPADIAVSQSTDQLLFCDELDAEYDRTLELADERSDAALNTASGNVFLAGSGLLVMPPVVLFMDLTGAEATEARAYRRRANHLASIIQNKCGIAMPRIDIGRDPYKEEADLAYARGEAAGTI